MEQLLEDLLNQVLTLIVGGGQNAIIAVLILVTLFLLWERGRLLHRLHERENKLDELMKDYYESNLTITKIIDSIKMVLIEIKAKIE